MPEATDPLRALVAHLREPGAAPLPAALPGRRVGLYRELVLRNLVGLLGASFPVLERVLGGERFRGLVADFLARHRCRTPYFPELPGEFLQFLATRQEPRDPPWLLELARHEWVELALANDPLELGEVPAVPGDPFEGVPVPNPLALPLAYRFPVHRLRPEHADAPPSPSPTWLVALRGRDDRVRFLEVSARSFALLCRLRESPPATGREHLLALAEAWSLPARELLAEGRAALARLMELEVLLGVRPGGAETGGGGGC
ncbi:MAG: putative DNA-binding domain-containing protein [Xanthomonadales bacterium]|nr:putative DNA-binding domain-containing protein [Xanthomonadales bacterium]